MTARTQPRTSRHVLHATDAEITAWFLESVATDQFPIIINMGPVYDDRGAVKYQGSNQIGVLGRDFESPRDDKRWWWMRDHQRAVETWLIANRMFAQTDASPPSSATLIARGLSLARGLGLAGKAGAK